MHKGLAPSRLMHLRIASIQPCLIHAILHSHFVSRIRTLFPICLVPACHGKFETYVGISNTH